MEDYNKFIEAKRHRASEYGIKPVFSVPGMFDFQQSVVEYAIKKGRCANYLDTG